MNRSERKNLGLQRLEQQKFEHGSWKIRRLLWAALLGLAALPASAQVTVAASAVNGATTTSGSNFTITPFTAGASANLLVVGVTMNIGSNPAAQVSTLTYGPRLMTFLSAHNNAANTRRVEFWYLKLPAAGVATTLTVHVGKAALGRPRSAAKCRWFPIQALPDGRRRTSLRKAGRL